MSDEPSATERRAQLILHELLRTGELSVGKMAKRLKVSAATIRRDLSELEQRGLLRRSHGGAIPIQPLLYEPFRHLSYYHEQERQRGPEKRRIALVAAEFVTDGDIIAIGAGTTATQVARSVCLHKGITVLTNAVNVAMELSHRDDLKIFVTGGDLSGDWFALVGPAAIQNASEMFVDKVFIGVDGIHIEHGLTTNYQDQASIHRAMMRQARQKIVVADHRKIGAVGTALICPADDINVLITDKGAKDEDIAPFTAKGITVRRA
ncbi:MAG TPA: DeoR/GlpR family DNA-binding transcription regulator [Pyrinomonadaceae bacterium]|nr:DeoR/GlpR family DNA-binding transcription regulator [Pyrinomonadaceae bacterium]